MPLFHISIVLSDKLCDFLSDWELEEKGFSITLDYASSNDVYLELLMSQSQMKEFPFFDGDLFHMRRCGHILSLIVHMMV